jgi:hypothetical protein
LQNSIKRDITLLYGTIEFVYSKNLKKKLFTKKINNLLEIPSQFIMKPNLVADEMFPEGAGPFMDSEDVSFIGLKIYLLFY